MTEAKGYDIHIGLEVHAQLNTETKVFCACKNSFGAPINAQCCPVCMGLPGALPVLNQKAVEKAVFMGLALNCQINLVSHMDRKNYFYPDLPKAYQISQFDRPLCEKGWLPLLCGGKEKRIGIERIHLEEDAGKLTHSDQTGKTIVDFNRCGVPLIEIVTAPDLSSSDEAKAFLDTIKRTLQFLELSDCKMEEGALRCDVNVSLTPCGSQTLGTRVEMKNVNTFSGAVRAIEFEIKRQVHILTQGGTVTQETRRWDDQKGISILLRTKEEAADYRFFPEPDLGQIVLEKESVEHLKKSLPELPAQKFMRFVDTFGFSEKEANALLDSQGKCALLEETAALGECSPKSIGNWILGDVSRKLKEGESEEILLRRLTPVRLSQLISLTEKGTISSTAGKKVFALLLQEDKDPQELVEKYGLQQISDENLLRQVVQTVLAQQEKSVLDYQNGKKNALGFLVGQCMRETKGKGNPEMISRLLLEALNHPESTGRLPKML